jgi:hypothetical protein
VTTEAAWLLAGLMTAHFLGDFTVLATPRMLESKATGRDFGWIAAHAGVHGALVTPVLLVFESFDRALAAIAVVTLSHLIIDAGRALLLVRYSILADATRKMFWSALGFDQLLHGLVLIWVASYVL